MERVQLQKIYDQQGDAQLCTINFVVSFPKCGRTWLRLILGRLFALTIDRKPSALSDSSPDFVASQDARIPRVAFSHDSFDHKDGLWNCSCDDLVLSDTKFNACNVFFLCRELKDTLVSCYFHKKYRSAQEHNDEKSYSGTLSEFIRSEYGARKLIKYYNLWNKKKNGVFHFRIIRYSDMHERCKDVLLNILYDLRVWPDLKAIDKAIQFADFKNVQSKEKSGYFRCNGSMIAQFDADPEIIKIGGDNALKLRRGQIGGYRDYMTDEDIDYVNSCKKQYLNKFWHDYV